MHFTEFCPGLGIPAGVIFVCYTFWMGRDFFHKGNLSREPNQIENFYWLMIVCSAVVFMVCLASFLAQSLPLRSAVSSAIVGTVLMGILSFGLSWFDVEKQKEDAWVDRW